jgi:protein AroM
MDNLTTPQIAALQLTNNETVYVSRLRDGSEVSIAKERLTPILEEKVEFLSKDVEVIVMLCFRKMVAARGVAFQFLENLVAGFP